MSTQIVDTAATETTPLTAASEVHILVEPETASADQECCWTVSVERKGLTFEAAGSLDTELTRAVTQQLIEHLEYRARVMAWLSVVLGLALLIFQLAASALLISGLATKSRNLTFAGNMLLTPVMVLLVARMFTLWVDGGIGRSLARDLWQQHNVCVVQVDCGPQYHEYRFRRVPDTPLVRDLLFEAVRF